MTTDNQSTGGCVLRVIGFIIIIVSVFAFGAVIWEVLDK